MDINKIMFSKYFGLEVWDRNIIDDAQDLHIVHQLIHNIVLT